MIDSRSLHSSLVYKFGFQKKGGVFFLFPVLVILFPVFPTVLPNYIGEQFVFILETIFVCGYELWRIKKYAFTTNSFFCFSLFFLLTIISILCDLFNQVLITNDLFELSRPFVYLLFYTLYRKSPIETNVIQEKTIDAIFFIFYVLTVYCILEFFFPNTIRPISYFLYKRQHLRNRAIGSFLLPYNFAYLLLLPLLYSLIYLLRYFSINSIFKFIPLFFVFLLTQSRSMYIACLVGFTIVFLLPCLYNKVKISIRTITIIAIIFVFITGIYLTYQEQLRLILGYAITGFEMMSEGTNNSVNTRQNQIIWAIENQKHIGFGAGIGKANIERHGIWLESLYALYYYRYGLIALLIYLSIIMTTAVFAYKIAKKETFNRKISTFYYSLFVFYLITPIGVLSGCSQDTPKVSLLFYGIMGLVHKKYYQLEAYRITSIK
jgi:hypothetical protein